MALWMSTETPDGQVGMRYWVCEKVIPSKRTGQARAHFHAYLDQAASDSDKASMEDRVVDFDYDLAGSNPFKQAYESAKAHNFFSSATSDE
uniref:Uncharacterized protein n=1 Tax=Magnetococcus massalia (strain MO-1) TaxID=451514 RepID=A0A1S7LHF5_MAGMO|nr:protein of unknown function [Candidatus Magnetococcus massalia]